MYRAVAGSVSFMAICLTLFGMILGVATPQSRVQANDLTSPPANEDFTRTWERPDRPVADLRVERTWMWGPAAITPLVHEEYAESPGGQRAVQYFDKARMEITNPNAIDDGLWYVTNGLLVLELITGRMQVGDGKYVERQPATVNVAGDPNTGPTYAALRPLLAAAARPVGQTVTERLAANGSVEIDSALADRAIVTAQHVPETRHTIARPFWEFMNSEGIVYVNGQFVSDELFVNPFYATGFPITEAYWTRVMVGGTTKDVLVQCFERRCLTYTPDNPPGWQVEAGNVGQHYYQWRYPADTPAAAPTAPSNFQVAAIDSSRFQLTWQDNSSNEEGFVIRDGTGDTGVQRLASNTREHVVGGYTAGQYVCFMVAAYIGSVESAFVNPDDGSPWRCATTLPASTIPQAPAAPTNLVAEAIDSRTVRLSWVDASRDETGFNVYGDNALLISRLPTDQTAYTVGGLKPNSTHCFTVTAVNEGGESPPSNQDCVKTPKPRDDRDGDDDDDDDDGGSD